jgi:hypothetical protein
VLRMSPKWCLGDALQKAKVRPSCSTVFKGAARRDRVGWQPSVEKLLLCARSTLNGDVRGEKVQISNLN